jgi:hypothetical protein
MTHSIPRFSFAFSALALAAIGSAQKAQPGANPTAAQGATYLAQGRQLTVICEHDHSKGGAGSTVLYKAVTVNASTLPKKVQVKRLEAIVVRFTHVNTFCYDYEAGVTKQLSFYPSNMPGAFKNFFVGGMASPIFLAQGGGDFSVAQKTFQQHWKGFAPLGAFSDKLREAYTSSIDPKLENAAIKTAVMTKLQTAFGFQVDTPTAKGRPVTPDDIQFRQSELEAGIKLLTDDITKVRANYDPNDAGQTSLLNADEADLELLTGQNNNFAAAITNLEKVQSAPEYVDKVVMLDTKADEYEITVAVALLKPDPKADPVSNPSVTDPSTFLVDIIGGPVLDFSAGVVATHPVTHDYFVAGNPKIIHNGGARDPGFVPAVFVSYYTRPAPGQWALGPTFGVDVSSLNNYFFGLSLTRGGAQRISLVGGLALNKLNTLNGDAVGSGPANGSSIQYKTRFGTGFFLGITFNLGG